jgi:hypothetical protein
MGDPSTRDDVMAAIQAVANADEALYPVLERLERNEDVGGVLEALCDFGAIARSGDTERAVDVINKQIATAAPKSPNRSQFERFAGSLLLRGDAEAVTRTFENSPLSDVERGDQLLLVLIVAGKSAAELDVEFLRTESGIVQPIGAKADERSSDSRSSTSALPGISPVPNPDDYISDGDWECSGLVTGMARASGLIRNPGKARESFLVFVGLFDEGDNRVGGLAAIVPTVNPGEAVEWSTPLHSLVEYDDFDNGTIEAIATFSRAKPSATPSSTSSILGISPVLNPDDYIGADDWECGGRDVGMARASGFIRNPGKAPESFLVFVALFDEQGNRVGGLAAIVPTVNPSEAVAWSTPASSLVEYDDFDNGTIEAIATFNRATVSERSAPRTVATRAAPQRAPQHTVQPATSPPATPNPRFMSAAPQDYLLRSGFLIGKLLRVVGVIFLVFMVWGYFRSDDTQFKLRCAVYQASGTDTLSLPDKMVCLTWYQLKQ